MQRRTFLRSLLAGAAGAAVAAVLPDPERLLWTPGEKSHFLPPAGGWSGVDFGLHRDISGLYVFRVSDLWPESREYDLSVHYRQAARALADRIDADIVALWKSSLQNAMGCVEPGTVIRVSHPDVHFLNPRQVGVIKAIA